MKAVITGGAGFIGSHLTDLLLKNKISVTVIDNLYSGSLRNLTKAKTHKNFNFINGDITQYDDIEKYFDGADWVFHLAGLADIVPSIKNPTNYFDVNVKGTLNVLESSVKHDVKKFIYAASSSSYGIPSEYPTPESSKINPQYPYALTKFMGEELVMHWNQIYNLNANSLRLFNVYGPRSRTSGAYGAVFGVFLSQKINKKPFTVVGDGKQTRDFTYVSDVVNAFYTAAKSKVSGEIMNVGSGNHYEINYLISLLEGDVEYIPKRPGEPDCTFADISKIKTLLNWEATMSLEDGVKSMLSYINDWKDAPLWNKDTIKDATKEWFKFLG
jgi:UDP-glucose 4-epimerase